MSAERAIALVDTSLRDALDRHRAQVARFAVGHGQPRRIHTMADTLRMDADFRTHHGGLTLRPTVLKLIAPAIGAAALAVLCGLLFVIAR